MLIESEPQITSVPKAPKEMLSATLAADGKYDVRINFSSLDLLQTCKRRAYYVLKRRLVSTNESAPLIFGTAIHAALEVWYCAPRVERRKHATAQCDDSQALMLAGQPPEPHGACVRCASVFAFLEAARPLAALDSSDKRSCANGVVVLNHYFDHYASDPFVVLSDAHGPFCERDFELPVLEDAHKRITFFGRIDTILRNEETGVILVTDHKTTASLGSDFYNRVRPNFQYAGYVLAAQRAFGLQTDMFLSNGIQVAKTVRGLARQVTQITSEDHAELLHAIDYAVDDYLRCERTDIWPQSTPNACTQWGGCAYRAICEVPAAIRENVIEAQYQVKEQASEAAS
jgi:hypothetical protein